jgi:hypothetical protein
VVPTKQETGTWTRSSSSNATTERTRVQAVKGFYVHASAYVLVNVALFVINLLVGGGWWFYWPLIGWGIGLGVHALSVFGFGGGGPWGQAWEERKIRELMDQDRRR